MFQFTGAKNRRLFYLIFLLTSWQLVRANEPTIVFTAPYIAIQQQVYSLLMDDALEAINKELKNNPTNFAGYCLLDNIYFLQSFISESQRDLKVFTQNHENAVAKLKAVTSNNPNKAYFLAETYTHKALLNFKAGNHYTAALALKEAHNWLVQNKNKHPNFLPTYKNLALFETAAANLTQGYTWILKIVGVNTQYQKSLDLAERFINTTYTNEWEIFRKETAFTLAYVHRQLLHDSKSMGIVKAHTLDYATNPLALYFLSTFSYKNGLNDLALQYINAFKPQPDQLQIPFIHYLKGICLLNKLDPSSYNEFNTYIQLHKGDNYIKSCYLKMAWSKILVNDMNGYAICRSKIETQGKTNNEEDKQAVIEFKRKSTPNLILLQSRLLFDGGYYTQSLQLIKGLKASDFTSTLLQTEYCYRKARLYQILEESELAIAFYKAAISTGRSLNVYYAAYSCIYIGDIYAEQGKKREAIDYYTQSMTFKANEEYRNSIEQRAKSSLRKL
jgi:tetratricopeptide (TPR) repeat protein